MNAPLNEGIFFFNAGDYFRAHETWEDLWRETEGHARPFYQGLIHAAVGLYHLGRGNRAGARSQLEKALQKLRQFPDSYLCVDNARLQADLCRTIEDSEPRTFQIAQIEHA